MDYEVLFYLLLGAFNALVADRIQSWLVRRRFEKRFGRGASQEAVDNRLTSAAHSIRTDQGIQKGVMKQIFVNLAKLQDLEPGSGGWEQKIKTEIKTLRLQSRQDKRNMQKSLRRFKNYRALAKHRDFIVRKSWKDYLP